MMLCHVSLVTIVVLVAGSGLPVGCPPYILAYPGITPVGRAKRDCTAVLRDRRMAAVTHLEYIHIVTGTVLVHVFLICRCLL